jgi:hypothetical protein
MPGFLRRSHPADDKKESLQDILEKLLRGYNACGDILESMSDAVVVTDSQLFSGVGTMPPKTIYGWTVRKFWAKSSAAYSPQVCPTAAHGKNNTSNMKQKSGREK